MLRDGTSCRPNGAHAKAGNLNNALADSSSQLIAVLDADHIVKPDFLSSCIPHLLDFDASTGKWGLGSYALIQTKQYFYNHDALMVR